MVRTTFAFSADEYYQGVRALTRHTIFRWLPWVLGIGIAGFLIVFQVLPHADLGSPSAVVISSIPYLLLGILWGVLLPLQQRWTAYRKAKSDPAAQGIQERGLDAEGFHSRSNGIVLDVPWRLFIKVVETDAFFLFFYNKQCAYFLPKRVLSAADVANTRSLIREHYHGMALLHRDG